MHICDIIHPGDTVLDLACGPATQLCMVARINPDINFIGIDMSQLMLERAKNQATQQELSNVSFRQGDISKLDFFEDGSIDAIISTMALHHLPTINHLHKTFKEVARVLKPDGGVYLADFGRLKSEKSMQSFAYQYADQQPELFTQDYFHSLKAAFSLNEFREAMPFLQGNIQLYSTYIMPFMVAIKSSSRFKKNVAIKNSFSDIKNTMSASTLADLSDLNLFFRMSGLDSSL
jgi:ubiquinone/menaquinone biosynthesis C-methylase UbiE